MSRKVRRSRDRLNSGARSDYSTRVISVIVADDHGIVREGLRRILDSESDLSVSAEAKDGREVLEEVERLHPDVVVLDITMPRLGRVWQTSLRHFRVRRSHAGHAQCH